MPRSLSEGVDIFLKSAERQGESGHDVRVSRSAPWMACVGGPVMMRTAISLFVENSHLETRHQGVMFRSPRAFVGSTATLRYEPCTQFINVSQKALHIYFIDGCRVCPLDAQYKNRVNQPRLCASAHRGVPLYFCMARNSQFTHFQSASRWAPRRVLSRSCWSC